ncbi:MAG: DsbA family protein [Pseudomonadota bacterium]
MVKKLLQPYALRVLTSERVRRWRDFPDRLRQRGHKLKPTVTLFHQLDDPYSVLALEASVLLAQRYDIEFELVLVEDEARAGHTDTQRAKEGWMRYRLHDARRLARAWQLKALEVDVPSSLAVEACVRALAAVPPANHPALALKLTRALWTADPNVLQTLLTEHPPGTAEEGRRLLINGHNDREARGHYQAAMWEFNGNWFWGLDRLEYLEDDLRRWGLAKGPSTVHGELYAPKRVDSLTGSTLDFFFSLRSPYTYVSLARINRLQQSTGVIVRLRPVLPMVERGVALSDHKRRFILNDVARITNKHEIAFGFIRDPLGPGLHRCLAMLPLMRERNREREFVASVMRGIWAEGISVNHDRGLQRLVERAGVSWADAQSVTMSETMQQELERNQQQLELMGIWGVPSFALTDGANRLVDVFWGQDRLPWLEYGLSRPSN